MSQAVRLREQSCGFLGPRVAAPTYNRARSLAKIVHIGVGSFNRSHMAVYLDDLLTREDGNWGEFGVGLLPADSAIHLALRAQDYLYGLLEKGAESLHYQVVGSLTGHCYAPGAPHEALEKMSADQCEIISLTVTEGGYFIEDATGEFLDQHPEIRHDLKPSAVPRTWLGYVAEAARRRMDRGAGPFTLMSCDNLQGNGHIARTALLSFAELKEPRLRRWIEANVSFPNSMVDRITPRTTDADQQIVAREFGVIDLALVVSEPFRQWVLEDTFTAGRPSLEFVGVRLTTDVAPYEAMKMRLLNGGHSSFAYCAALLGFEYVADALADPALRQLLLAFLAEVRPALRPLPGIDLEVYAATIVDRFANPRIRDQIARICSTGCAKLTKFIVPSVRCLLKAGAPLRVAPLVIASWLHYIGGADDGGNSIEIADPALGSLDAFCCAGHADASLALSVRPLFGDLAEAYPTFVESVQRSLGDFRNLGTRKAIERVLIHDAAGRN